jgi:hypothetical protein
LPGVERSFPPTTGSLKGLVRRAAQTGKPVVFHLLHIHDSNKAYQRVALRDFNLQSYVSVASTLQIQKITEAVT